MYYVQIYNGKNWISAFKFMCKSIAYYYRDIIHKEDKCLTRVQQFYTINER